MIKPKNVIIFEGPTVLFSAIGTPSLFLLEKNSVMIALR
jgi:hypothetical protein